MMKHIGIVDITTIGACICANTIVAEAARRNASGVHPEFTMHAFSFAVYKALISSQNWLGLAEVIMRSIEKLASAGADFIIIPSNTPHFGYSEIIKKSPLPILNLVEITSDECARRGFKKVAVLGTKFTMQGGLYDRMLIERGITPVIPDEAGCNEIHRLIMEEIIPSKVTPKSVAKVRGIILSLECDAVILGCTELPELYSEENLGRPAIDTTRLLAHKALDFAMLDAEARLAAAVGTGGGGGAAGPTPKENGSAACEA